MDISWPDWYSATVDLHLNRHLEFVKVVHGTGKRCLFSFGGSNSAQVGIEHGIFDSGTNESH